MSTSTPATSRFTPWHWLGLAVSVAPLAFYAFSPRAKDLELYFNTARAFLAGATPNQDFRF